MKMLLVVMLSTLFYATAGAQSQYSLQPQGSDYEVPASLLGTWGSAEQCAAHRAGGNLNPALFPYLITRDWIRQGNIYCYLSWQHHRASGGNIEAYVSALCGEDDIRDYRLLMKLQAGSLQIRWSPDFITGQLQACG